MFYLFSYRSFKISGFILKDFILFDSYKRAMDLISFLYTRNPVFLEPFVKEIEEGCFVCLFSVHAFGTFFQKLGGYCFVS